MKRLALLFGMSENERRGFLVLSVLIGLIGGIPFVYSFYRQAATDDILVIATIAAEEQKALEPKKTFQSNTEEIRASHNLAEKSFFSFDPNNLPAEKWKMLGFTESQIQVIKNYESKGGRFRTKADVAKMYVVSDEDFKRLEPYILLPETLPARPQDVTFSAKKAPKPSTRKLWIDLSTADTTTLKEIHGIGSVLASRIVKFRDALGGFHRVDQIKEVYGVSEEQFLKMESSLTLGDNAVEKWAINQLSVDKLAQHPYISRKEATHIVRYREQHGAFSSLADLEEMYALNDDFLRKIAPYLDFN
ncbi:helix-hairpin-helix domain-containing protein [Sphingobacterium corticibacterium]|uniref:Helix-hairpin-helix domain-containing protein n=1 Tax=Sphingobacterium corticibacterium TaxID=2484746 RepID=A0A4Q6Y0H8_9SPHI|nr:helix-hairpin-helix domain-containing protein [Sphingobacterium corticibacterium]RZF62456.1 helix-hairpin-helix domain-containing protein [Sphingobacterium corticibacterium]